MYPFIYVCICVFVRIGMYQYIPVCVCILESHSTQARICMYCMYRLYLHVCMYPSVPICIACIIPYVYIRTYLYVSDVSIRILNIVHFRYIQIHTIHSDTEICILACRYAHNMHNAYLYVSSFEIYTIHTCIYWYIQICTYTFTDAGPAWLSALHHTAESATGRSRSRPRPVILPQRATNTGQQNGWKWCRTGVPQHSEASKTSLGMASAARAGRAAAGKRLWRRRNFHAPRCSVMGKGHAGADNQP